MGPEQSNSAVSNADRFRAIPSISDAVSHVVLVSSTRLSANAVVSIAQAALANARREIELGIAQTREQLLQRVVNDVALIDQPKLSPLINATGILIHTNLGRAPVSPETAQAMALAASSYVPLEVDPETNERGSRMREPGDLMRLLTGAESTLVVNNNAAAVLLTLGALAAEKEVIVSRGEAVEIGGGFRIPDVMRQSGARLVEVGTTNRTYASDYRSALSDRTAAILKVHQSNFRIEGFTAVADLEELVEIGRAASVPVIDDQGSGAMLDAGSYGLATHSTIQSSIAAGVSIVTASGDKLLGGPQAGMICGESRFVDQIAKHPLARAVRADKSCLAGIAATLRHYLHGDATERIPVWRMIAVSEREIRDRAEAIAGNFRKFTNPIDVVPTRATTGGGSLPGEELPSWALSVGEMGGRSVEQIARALRTGQPRVFGRIHEGQLLLDLRSVLPEDDERLGGAIGVALSASS